MLFLKSGNVESGGLRGMVRQEHFLLSDGEWVHIPGMNMDSIISLPSWKRNEPIH